MIRIHEVELLSAKTGMGLRCHLTIGLGNERSITIKGCLAFRDRKSVLRFLPPVTRLRNRAGLPYNYKAVLVSPDLGDDLARKLEAQYGHLLHSYEGNAGAGIPVGDVQPGILSELEV